MFVISHYGTKTWQLIPIPWRHWWIDNLKHVTTGYENISIDSPEPIIIDQSFELKELNTQIESQMLFEIAKACNKFMIPNVLCPWGCNEFIFRCGYISIDIVFQQFLRMVSLNLINNIEVMKYVAYCRDDYIQFNGDYECLLLNKSWTVMPSICLRDGYGVQVMTCKDHDHGCNKCMIHPPRQPNHILPSQYSDQICHAVIKPRTITVPKAQRYTNTYQLFEQRGNFNGIDTCSVTQYRNFKLLSYLLQENEIRSLKGRADINALLTQIVHEKDLSLDMASKIRQIAENSPFDINKLSYGATYVPIDVAIDLGNDKLRDVVWDSGGAQLITPCFPTFI